MKGNKWVSFLFRQILPVTARVTDVDRRRSDAKTCFDSFVLVISDHLAIFRAGYERTFLLSFRAALRAANIIIRSVNSAWLGWARLFSVPFRESVTMEKQYCPRRSRQDMLEK